MTLWAYLSLITRLFNYILRLQWLLHSVNETGRGWMMVRVPISRNYLGPVLEGMLKTIQKILFYVAISWVEIQTSYLQNTLFLYYTTECGYGQLHVLLEHQIKITHNKSFWYFIYSFMLKNMYSSIISLNNLTALTQLCYN